MRTVWAVEGAIATAVVAAAATVLVVLLVLADAGTEAWIAGLAGVAVVLACAFGLVRLRPAYEHEHFRFEVTELGLYVARGWLWRRWEVVPYARIETVDVKSGPLLRAFGLVSVLVSTAAAKGGTGIPGLGRSEADALVEELARRAGIEERT